MCYDTQVLKRKTLSKNTLGRTYVCAGHRNPHIFMQNRQDFSICLHWRQFGLRVFIVLYVLQQLDRCKACKLRICRRGTVHTHTSLTATIAQVHFQKEN